MIFNLLCIQLLYAQHPKKWLLESDSLEIINTLVDISSVNMMLNDSLFQNEVLNLKEKIIKKGYFDVEIRNKSTDSTYITSINLNNRIEHINVQTSDIEVISGIFPFSKSNDNQLKIPIEKIDKFLQDLSNYYQNEGFPFVQVRLQKIEKKVNSLQAELIIDKGNLVEIDKIIVKGYEQFPTKFIKNKLQLYEYQIYSKHILEDISNKIKYIPFVSEIKKPEMLFTKDSTYVYLYLGKVKSSSIDGLIGFASSEITGKLILNGYLDLKLQNAFNKGEILSLNWQSDSNKMQTLQTNVEIPYIFNTPIELMVQLDLFKKDTLYFNLSNKININYQTHLNHKIGFEWLYLTSNTITSNILNELSDLNAHFYGITSTFQKMGNSPVFPHKFILKNTVSTGTREKEKQFKLESNSQYFYNFNRRNYISFQNKTGMLFSDVFYDNELFRLGGNQSIRGFQDNSVLAQKYTFFNVGYHFLTDAKAYFSAMTDVAIIKYRETQNLYSFGIGYTTKTETGDFHLNYFIGKTSNSNFSLKNSFLHVSFSQNF